MKKDKYHQLVKIGLKRFKEPKSQLVHFTGIVEADKILNDLKNYPHAFVLSCLMDRQIKAERAWLIPYEIYKAFGSFSFKILASKNLRTYKTIFRKKLLHRFYVQMAEVFYSAVRQIKEKYDGNASLIWSGRPSSSTVVYRFLEFKGSGIKIATMAVNILATQFRIPFSDYYSIDISPDVHIKRVLKRMGLVPKFSTNEMIIYKARELYPEFPGIIDFSCWEIGRNWCRPKDPDCNNCIVKKDCPKIL